MSYRPGRRFTFVPPTEAEPARQRSDYTMGALLAVSVFVIGFSLAVFIAVAYLGLYSPRIGYLAVLGGAVGAFFAIAAWRERP